MASKKTAIYSLFCIAALSGCSLFSSPAPTPVVSSAGAVTPVAVAMRDSSESPDQIRGVQTKLASEGLYAGAVDGVWGPATSSALGHYQINHSLEATGKLNTQTTDAMDVATAPGPNTPLEAN